MCIYSNITFCLIKKHNLLFFPLATYSNQDWADFSLAKYTVEEINEFERFFLRRIDFSLYITETAFDNFLAYLDILLCLRKIRIWGWRLGTSTYRDLATLSQQLSPLYMNHFRSVLRPLEVLALMIRVVAHYLAYYIFAIAFMAAVYEYGVKAEALGYPSQMDNHFNMIFLLFL